MRERPSRRTQLWAVLRKETLQTVRDRRLVFMLLFAPIVQLMIFGFAIDFKVDHLPTLIADQDFSAASRDHIRRLLADGTLEGAGHAAPEDAERALISGAASAVVVFPAGFSKDLARGGPAEVQVVLDGSDSNRSTVAAAAVSRYFAEAGAAWSRSRLASSGGSLELRPRIAFNPELDSPPYMIPGVMAMLLIVVTTIVTAMGLAREREMGTLEQVLVTPIRPSVLLLGKMLPFVVIGIFNVLFALTVGVWLFGVPLRGNPAVLVVAALAYLMTTLGVGLLISTLSRTQQQSFLGGFLFTLPAMLLSGVMTPIRAMPGWLQAITRLNPLRYFVEILRANLLTGAGFELVWPKILVLVAFGAGLLVIAARRFQKRIA